MGRINVDFTNIKGFANVSGYASDADRIRNIKSMLIEKRAEGSEYTGWVDLPEKYDKAEFDRILKATEKIQSDSEVLVVLGIGGSYLGAKAACDFLFGADYNLKKAKKLDTSNTPEIYFAGNSLNTKQINDILKYIDGRDFSVNVISKSGTTMETALAFRIFKKAIEEKYGKQKASERIYVTTDRQKGALKKLVDEEGYTAFVVPDDVGGRFSVLTAVGLLPIAAAGGDIKALMQGAAAERAGILHIDDSNVLKYAWLRQELSGKGKDIEIFGVFDPELRQLTEWLKQLFGESEGKDGKGIFPASVCYTTDLHSLGQLVQDGKRNIFETVITVKEDSECLEIPAFDEDFDSFKYLEGKNLSIFNGCAIEGTAQAHYEGGVPGIRIEIEKKDEASLGALFYFFEFACGISAYIEGVNPFNQPGVEQYKKNIKALLAKYR